MKIENRKVIFVGLGIIIIALLLLGFIGFSGSDNKIKIGIITDLSGPAAYWGESSRVGAELAAKELNDHGYNVELIFEDYQLDATKALSSAQKLVNLDNVNAIYADFNPAAISVGSFLGDKDVLFIYDAAVTSTLKNNPLSYKTYLSYQEGCKQVALRFKQEGMDDMGVLKVNMEAGELCLAGVREVYPNTHVESYNFGDQDFKTPILKLKNKGINVIISAFFEGDTLNALKVIREQDLDIKFGTVDDSITDNVRQTYPEELEGIVSFGFSEVSKEFEDKISNDNLATDYAAAIAYIHIKQIARVIKSCGNDKVCIVAQMDSSPQDNTLGFNGFKNHIADLDMAIKQY